MNEFWKGVSVGKEISDSEREEQRRISDINIVAEVHLLSETYIMPKNFSTSAFLKEVAFRARRSHTG